MDELFSIPETLSPRLKWIQDRNITVIDNGTDFESGEESPETGDTLFRFCAFVGEFNGFAQKGYGDTENEALTRLAMKLNIRLWNEPHAQPPHPTQA